MCPIWVKYRYISRNKKKKNKFSEYAIVVEEGNRNIINEAFRVLRSNVDFMKSKNTEQKVFIETSFIRVVEKVFCP